MVNPYLGTDPTQPNYKAKLLAALQGTPLGPSLQAQGDPNDPTHGAEPGGFSGGPTTAGGSPSNPTTTSTTEPTKTEGPAIPPTTTGGTSAGNGNPDVSGYNNGLGMPQWLADIYNNAGVKAQGRGAGFTDWQYWQDKQSQADRLRRDLAGTGTDNPGPGDSGAALGSHGNGDLGNGTGAGSTPFDPTALLGNAMYGIQNALSGLQSTSPTLAALIAKLSQGA